MIKEGIYPALSSEFYHNDKASISRSSIMDFKRSPRNYWMKHLNPDRPEKQSTPDMEFGTAFHTLILESHLFEEQYFVLPEKVLLKNVGREKYDEYKRIEAEAEGTNKIVLTCEEFQRLRDMRESLLSHSKARELIENATYESSYFWKDKDSGLMLKARPDILHHNLYVDLKTIADASPESFQRDMATSGYYIQAAMVEDAVIALQGHKLSASINICIEKKYPYLVGIYIIDEAAIEYGRNEYKSLLQRMNSCIIANEYEHYEIATIGLPGWFK